MNVHEDEDGYYVGFVPQLGVSSFGTSLDEAIHETMDAACLLLNTLDDEGATATFLAERGIEVHEGQAGHEESPQPVSVRPGEVVTSQIIPVGEPALAVW